MIWSPLTNTTATYSCSSSFSHPGTRITVSHPYTIRIMNTIDFIQQDENNKNEFIVIGSKEQWKAVRTWLHEMAFQPKRTSDYIVNGRHRRLTFDNKSEAMLFKLKWIV